jgi:signal transduction histidine kinase
VEYSRIALEQVRRAGGITRRFLELARGRAPDRGIIDLPETAELVVRLVAPTARQAGVTVVVAGGGPPVPKVFANAGAVQQVLLNLVLNAVEASPKGGRVTLSFAVGEAVELRVEDEGPGVDPALADRIFEPFFTSRAGGTGLGLFVSLGLARAWEGDIRVVSAERRGATFLVVFPRRDEEAPHGAG